MWRLIIKSISRVSIGILIRRQLGSGLRLKRSSWADHSRKRRSRILLMHSCPGQYSRGSMRGLKLKLSIRQQLERRRSRTRMELMLPTNQAVVVMSQVIGTTGRTLNILKSRERLWLSSLLSKRRSKQLIIPRKRRRRERRRRRTTRKQVERPSNLLT